MIDLNKPWTASVPDEYGISRIRDSSGRWIGSIYDTQTARAVAALPTLLAACREALQYMLCGEPSRGNGCIEPEGWAEVIEELRAALAAIETPRHA